NDANVLAEPPLHNLENNTADAISETARIGESRVVCQRGSRHSRSLISMLAHTWDQTLKSSGFGRSVQPANFTVAAASALVSTQSAYPSPDDPRSDRQRRWTDPHFADDSLSSNREP